MKTRSAAPVEAMRGNIKSTGIDFPGYRVRMKSELTHYPQDVLSVTRPDWSGAQWFPDRFWFERVASWGCCKKRGNAGMISGRTWPRSRLHVLDESVGRELRLREVALLAMQVMHEAGGHWTNSFQVSRCHWSSPQETRRRHESISLRSLSMMGRCLRLKRTLCAGWRCFHTPTSQEGAVRC